MWVSPWVTEAQVPGVPFTASQAPVQGDGPGSRAAASGSEGISRHEGGPRVGPEGSSAHAPLIPA